MLAILLKFNFIYNAFPFAIGIAQ